MTGTTDSESNVVPMCGVSRIAPTGQGGNAMDATSAGTTRRDNDDELWTRLEHKFSERDAQAHKETHQSGRKAKSWLRQIFTSIGICNP